MTMASDGTVAGNGWSNLRENELLTTTDVRTTELFATKRLGC
jgi:hypothetical protein